LRLQGPEQVDEDVLAQDFARQQGAGTIAAPDQTSKRNGSDQGPGKPLYLFRQRSRSWQKPRCRL